MGKPGKKVGPETILGEFYPEVRQLAEIIRNFILQVVPQADEKAYPTWRGIGYRHPEMGYFCGIFPQEDGIRLGFEFGVLLPDPLGLLEGNGKQVRYVHLETGGDIPWQAIHDLLEAAINLPSKREVRLWLVENAARPPGEK